MEQHCYFIVGVEERRPDFHIDLGDSAKVKGCIGGTKWTPNHPVSPLDGVNYEGVLSPPTLRF